MFCAAEKHNEVKTRDPISDMFHPLLQRKESKGSRLEQHIHFWLGAQSSQDEAGVAAYKTVELDEFLGGAPIQHR